MSNLLNDALVHEIIERIKVEPEFSEVEFHKGWPSETDFSLPSISLETNTVEYEKGIQVYETRDVDETTIDVFYMLAMADIPLTLNVWAKTKTARGILCDKVQELFFPQTEDENGSPVFRVGMSLKLSKYHDVSSTVRIFSENNSDARNSREKSFRTTYDLKTSVPKLKKITYNKSAYLLGETIVQTEDF